jgi:hypothetical protein
MRHFFGKNDQSTGIGTLNPEQFAGTIPSATVPDLAGACYQIRQKSW